MLPPEKPAGSLGNHGSFDLKGLLLFFVTPEALTQLLEGMQYG
jgi:hypothetical protein